MKGEYESYFDILCACEGDRDAADNHVLERTYYGSGV